MICHQLRRKSGELYLETIFIHSVFDSICLEFIFTDFSINDCKGYFQNKICDNQNTKLQLLASKCNIICCLAKSSWFEDRCSWFCYKPDDFSPLHIEFSCGNLKGFSRGFDFLSGFGDMIDGCSR